MVNNLDWLGPLSLIDFLRDIGKHFTIPYMLAKDSVQVRLERGLSFTEFSYMLLQAYDFLHLHRTLRGRAPDGRRRPVGQHHGRSRAHPAHERRWDGRRGSGPRARLQAAAHAVGHQVRQERERDSVWLDPARTSPYAFYQHWLNTDDRDVGTYLRWFTELSRDEIEALEAELARAPEGARGAARARARHHRPDARRGGRRRGRSPIPRRSSRPAPIDDPAVLASLYDVRRRVRVRSVVARRGASRSCSPRPGCSPRRARRGG